MDFLTTLWLPIILSAVFVFILSTVIHMFLNYHHSDFKRLPDEDGAMDTLRGLNLPPSLYMVPYPENAADMRSEEFQAKVKKGPVIHMNVRSGDTNMAKSLVQWFVYCIVIGIFAAYIGVNSVGADGDYLDVFRFVGCAAFMGYSLAFIQDAIWQLKNWSAVLKSLFDGLLYALITAGTFGWLWV